MKTTFIYTLADPSTGAIRYVGKTDDPANRLRAHRRCKDGTTARWVQSLLATPVLEVLEEIPSHEWMFWEQHWIQVLRGYGFDLLNVDNGGLDQYRLTPAIKQRISDTLKGRPNIGAQQVLSSYDKQGRFVMSYPSFQDAARAVNGSHGNISRAITKNRSAYGYLWRHGNSEERIESPYVNGKVPVSEHTRALLSKHSLGRKRAKPFSDITIERMRNAAMRRWHPELRTITDA